MDEDEVYVCDKCGDESVTEDICSVCGQVIEHLDPETAHFIPRPGNAFAMVTKCPNCHQVTEIEFMAFIDEWRVNSFKIGDEVFAELDQESESMGCPLEGVNSWGELIDVDFWVYGTGRCWECNNTAWARIEVRDNTIVSIKLVPKPESTGFWDILKKWWRLDPGELK